MVQGNPLQFLQLNDKTNSVTLLQAPREGCQDFGPKHREDNPISLYKNILSSLVQERGEDWTVEDKWMKVVTEMNL